MVPLFGLAPGGVCRALRRWPRRRCALTAPFHHHHARLATPFGCLLSVALSVGSRRPGVTWHPALWSPDFPRHAMRDATVWPTPRGKSTELGTICLTCRTHARAAPKRDILRDRIEDPSPMPPSDAVRPRATSSGAGGRHRATSDAGNAPRTEKTRKPGHPVPRRRRYGSKPSRNRVSGSACTSNAPMSAATPTSRVNSPPRWSPIRLAVLLPASIAGLPAASACVGV